MQKRHGYMLLAALALDTFALAIVGGRLLGVW